jgi:rubrerythrin
MELSRDEVVQIAKEAAHQVIESLNRYPVQYEVPRDIEEGLRQSMIEESTAANWYRRRGMDTRLKGDTVTADLYEHIAREENQHYQQFKERLDVLIPVLSHVEG